MRLTNVSRVALPEGALHVLTASIPEGVGRELPISFDQRRHVGEGDRPGSWMALAFEAPDGTDLDSLARGWSRVIGWHGALRTVFSADAGSLRLNEARPVARGWSEHPVPVGRTVRDVLHDVLDASCRPFSRPSHLLAAITPDAGPTVVVIASDHSHVDMWSLLVLARDLLDADAAAAADADPAAELPADFATHTALLESLPPAPDAVVTRWAEILDAGGGDLPVFPLPLGDVSRPIAEVVEVRDILDEREVRTFDAVADGIGVRPTALALSILTRVTRELADAPLRAVFPVHSRHEPRWHDSVGWFITNSVLECTDPDPRACAASVKEALALGSHPLAPILGRDGVRATPGMFAISWFDARRLPVVPGARHIQFVSAAIKTDGVMVWFILNETGMHLRCRYPDTPEARTNVGRWLDAVGAGLQETVETPASARPAVETTG